MGYFLENEKQNKCEHTECKDHSTRKSSRNPFAHHRSRVSARKTWWCLFHIRSQDYRVPITTDRLLVSLDWRTRNWSCGRPPPGFSSCTFAQSFSEQPGGDPPSQADRRGSQPMEQCRALRRYILHRTFGRNATCESVANRRCASARALAISALAAVLSFSPPSWPLRYAATGPQHFTPRGVFPAE